MFCSGITQCGITQCSATQLTRWQHQTIACCHLVTLLCLQIDLMCSIFFLSNDTLALNQSILSNQLRIILCVLYSCSVKNLLNFCITFLAEIGIFICEEIGIFTCESSSVVAHNLWSCNLDSL